MLFRVILPLVFVGLWSSAFVTAKVGVVYATPFAMLLTRFSLVSLLFLVMLMATQLWVWSRRRAELTAGTPRPGLLTLLLTALVGVLLHGVYLGSVFFALSVGLSAGISALIVSLQPILASFLAIFLFAEKLRLPQVAGITIGLLGVVLVLLPKLDGAMPALGLASVTIGLIAITGGTLLQKQIGNRIELLTGNIVQSIAASLFFVVVCSTIENPQINWELPFVIALAWQVVMVSAGAYLILMVLIQRDNIAATSSLLFLVPPVTAVIAAIGFDEPLTLFSLTGFVVTSAGVYLVTRYKTA